MKGQATIEFVGSMLIFLIVLVASLTVMSDRVPEFTEDVKQSSKNMEMYRLTNTMLTKTGRHSYGAGGPDWDKNGSTVTNVEDFGLAEDYHVLDKGKVDNLSTTGKYNLNYSQFRDLKNLDHQYYMNFTWMPVVETSSSFTRNNPPSNPPITQPPNASGSFYSNAENRVHYGDFTVLGNNYKFLVTAYNGVYNTTYISSSWDFSSSIPRGVGYTATFSGREFTLNKIQNRNRQPGTSLIFTRQLNSFGVNSEGAEGTVTKLNRYATLDAPSSDDEIVRIEVLAW